MFAGKAGADRKARKVASWIGNHNNFKAHPRQIGIADLQAKGVEVFDLRGDSALRDAIWAVWSAYRVTFDQTGAYKMFENSRGEAFVRNLEQLVIQLPAQAAPQAPSPQPTPNRVQRRRKQRGR